jgi:hypothetical protein
MVIYLTQGIMMRRPGGHGETSLLEMNPLYPKYKSNKAYFSAFYNVAHFEGSRKGGRAFLKDTTGMDIDEMNFVPQGFATAVMVFNAKNLITLNLNYGEMTIVLDHEYASSPVGSAWIVSTTTGAIRVDAKSWMDGNLYYNTSNNHFFNRSSMSFQHVALGGYTAGAENDPFYPENKEWLGTKEHRELMKFEAENVRTIKNLAKAGQLPGVQAHQPIRQKILNPFNTGATVGKQYGSGDKPGLVPKRMMSFVLEIKGSNKKAAVLKPLLAA